MRRDVPWLRSGDLTRKAVVLVFVASALSAQVAYAAVGPANPAVAVFIDPGQASAVQAAIRAAIAAETAKKYPDAAASDAGMIAALNSVFLSYEDRFGAGASGSLTSIFIATGLLSGVSQKAIGSTLGLAATAPNHETGGPLIALDVANEGTAVIIQAFVEVVKARGQDRLAQIALGDPDAIAEISSSAFPLSAAPPGPAPLPCANPSCS